MKNTEEASRASKVLEILSAFEIYIKVDEDKEEDMLFQSDDGRSNQSMSPTNHLKVPCARPEGMGTLHLGPNSYNESDFHNSARTSYNIMNSLDGKVSGFYNALENYLKNASIDIDKILNSSRKGVNIQGDENSTHQICNIKIKELSKYCNHLEGENVSLTKRLQHQININDELEKDNSLIDSKYTNKLNENEVLKTCLKQNTEITKELQKILSSTSCTLDLTKVNNKTLVKKLKKYKKILKHKDQELNSVSNYAIGESLANDIGMMFYTGDSSRPVSSSSNLQRFNSSNISKRMHPQSNLM